MLTLPPPARRLSLCCALAIAGLGGAVSARAQSEDSEAEQLAKLKAAFVLNFARYAHWPEASFADGDSPIQIGIAGDDSVLGYLVTLVEEEVVNGRSIEVRRLDGESLRPVSGAAPIPALTLYRPHLIFIGQGSRLEALEESLEGLAAEDVLTVGDLEGFAERGGMIGLVLRGRRLGIDANLDRIAASRVSISSQVLRLARIVNPRSS